MLRDIPIQLTYHKGRGKDDILHEFEKRIGNSRPQEFATACAQVERIALLRLKDILP